MMSGMPLETCWAFKKLWNNKFYHKAASCWYFYWVIYDELIHEYLIYKTVVGEMTYRKTKDAWKSVGIIPVAETVGRRNEIHWAETADTLRCQ